MKPKEPTTIAVMLTVDECRALRAYIAVPGETDLADVGAPGVTWDRIDEALAWALAAEDGPGDDPYRPTMGSGAPWLEQILEWQRLK